MKMNNTVNLMIRGGTEQDTAQEFVSFGKDVLSSEEMTDKVYSAHLSMMVDCWEGVGPMNSRKELRASDIGALYVTGPYLPCVKRIAFTRNVDLVTDGLPGIRVAANLHPNGTNEVGGIIPVSRTPEDIQILGRAIKKYKFIALYPGDKDKGESKLCAYVLWFGIDKSGRVLPAYNKRMSKPVMYNGMSQIYPSMVANAWADARNLWVAETAEDIGNMVLRLRLGLNPEHIKSLFYARSLPVTETGRKRPILHWVHANTRRIAGGIDIDVQKHLRGVSTVEMDSLRLRITQPQKNSSEAGFVEPNSPKQALNMYREFCAEAT